MEGCLTDRFHRLFHSSLAKTLVGAILLVAIPMTLLSFVSSYSSVNTIREQTDQSYISSTKLIAAQFSDKLRDLDVTSASLSIDNSTVRLSNTQGSNADLYEYSEYYTKLLLTFNSRFISANVSAIFPEQRWVISTRYGVEKFEKYGSLQDLSKLNRDQPMWAIRPSLRAPSERAFSMISGFVHTGQSRPLISIEISENEVRAQLQSLFQENNQVLAAFLMDSNGELIKFDPNQVLGEELVQKIRTQRKASELVPFSYHQDQQDYRIVFSELDNCVIGAVLNEYQILAPIRRTFRWLAVILVFLLLATVGYLLLTYKKIYNPVNELEKTMKQVAVGNLQVRVSTGDRSEIGMIALQFNQMLDQLEKLLNEKYIAQVKLKKAQLRFLKAQINPHFLYNCLFNIYNMIKSGDTDTAADMSIYLGRYYQLSTHWEDNDTILQKEIENIRLYLTIHQLRSARLEFFCSVDPSLEDLAVPVLSLQTLVENAMSHAFNQQRNKNVLKIIAAKDADEAVLSVEDNGDGISEEELVRIRADLRESENIEDTHGLQNVNARVRLMYGGKAYMTVDSAKMEGTRVSIHIPQTAEGMTEEGHV